MISRMERLVEINSIGKGEKYYKPQNKSIIQRKLHIKTM